MPLMGVWVILGLFDFLKKIPTDGGGVTLNVLTDEIHWSEVPNEFQHLFLLLIIN